MQHITKKSVMIIDSSKLCSTLEVHADRLGIWATIIKLGIAGFYNRRVIGLNLGATVNTVIKELVKSLRPFLSGNH